LENRVSDSIPKLRSRLARQQEALKFSHDADSRRSASEEGRLIRQEVAQIKSRPEFVRDAVRFEIDQFVEGFAIHVASQVDPKVNAQIHRLAGHARDALAKSNPHSIVEARKSLEEIRALLFGALAKQPEFWVVRFESLAEDRHLAVDKDLHDRLVREGEASIRTKDIDFLRALTFQMDNNIMRVGGPGRTESLSGLTHT
jgi:molecular chaperone DnaK